MAGRASADLGRRPTSRRLRFGLSSAIAASGVAAQNPPAGAGDDLVVDGVRPRRPLLRAAPLALLLLTACGDPTPTARGCDRIGLLCANNNQPSRLGLASARGSTADLDGDGQLDLITAAPPGLSIAWSGTSQRDYHLEYGSVPDAKIGDIDGDGDPDIVFITADPPALHTLTSDRTRTLRDGPTLALAGRPQGLWIGQLDADDALDAAYPGTIRFVWPKKSPSSITFPTAGQFWASGGDLGASNSMAFVRLWASPVSDLWNTLRRF